MKNHHFGTTGGIQETCAAVLKAIQEKAYRDTFDAWKSRWRCIDARGKYFKGF